MLIIKQPVAADFWMIKKNKTVDIPSIYHLIHILYAGILF